jgi:3-hydroxyisobutyrate dehydrogenase
MLPAGPQVRAVYPGDDGILAQSAGHALLIDCSTIDVETAREVAAEAEARGHAMVDAPVSGGVGGAEAGTLTFMVGGSDAALPGPSRFSPPWARPSSTPADRAPARPPRSATT